ncbi:MAG: hypothetical protein AAF828_02085 [Bacteroidota bacterium]
MKITESFIDECQVLIGEGETEAVIDRLLQVKGQTAYKNQIIGLAGRWKVLERARLNDSISSEEMNQRTNRLNQHSLQLLDALKGEMNGEDIEDILLPTSMLGTGDGSRKYALGLLLGGMALAAIAAFGISFATLKSPARPCEERISLSGSWLLSARVEGEEITLGEVSIHQDECVSKFRLSGMISAAAQENKEIDFSSKMGDVYNGEILFYYENFDGEKGVCRGVEPARNKDSFTVMCTDLIGFDRNDEPNLQLVFRRDLDGE